MCSRSDGFIIIIDDAVISSAVVSEITAADENTVFFYKPISNILYHAKITSFSTILSACCSSLYASYLFLFASNARSFIFF